MVGVLVGISGGVVRVAVVQLIKIGDTGKGGASEGAKTSAIQLTEYNKWS